ncbi:MAG: hypothetical protein AAF682_08660 [Planctomycetota bacterium]
MLPRRITYPTLVLAPLALAAASARDEAGFAPAGFTVLTKNYVEETSLEVDSFEVLVDGAPMEQELPEVSMTAERRVTLSDEYEEVADGRVRKLLRTYEGLMTETTVSLDDGDLEEHTATAASELEDATVRFEWDEDSGEYRRSLEEGGGDEEVLGRLVQEADFLGFLPDDAVEEDDEWEVDPDALARVFAAGGDLAIEPTSLGDERYVNMEVPAMLASTLTNLGEADGDYDGKIEAKYNGADEIDGVAVGRIGFAVDASVELDLGERLVRATDSFGEDLDFNFEDFLLTWNLDGEGELLWNLEAGHVHSFRWAGDVELEAELGWAQAFFDQELGMRGVYRLSGTSSLQMTLGD